MQVVEKRPHLLAIRGGERGIHGDFDAFASLDFLQPQIAREHGIQLRRIGDLHGVNVELMVPQQCQRLVVAVWIEEIAEHKNESAPFHPSCKNAARFGEIRLTRCRRFGAQKIERFVELAFTAHEAGVAPERGVEIKHVDAIKIGEADVAERRGDAARLVEFRERARARRPKHRGAGIHEQVDVQILLLLEKLDEQTIQASVDVPVNVPQIIAGGVISIVGELQAGADLLRTSLGALIPAKQFSRQQIELLQLREKRAVEKRGSSWGIGHGASWFPQKQNSATPKIVYARRIVNEASLQLFRFIEDAWQDGLREWLDASAAHVLNGQNCWVVIGSRGQARWLKRRALQEGLSLFGVQFMEPLELRRKLCAALGIEARPVGREILQMLLEIAVPDCSQPGALLQALDEAQAGGLPVAECLRQIPAKLLSKLKASHSWTPALDEELEARAKPQPLQIAFVGVGAEFSPSWMLFHAAMKCAESVRCLLPQPRDVASCEFAWIEQWERALSVSHTVCGAGKFESRGDDLVEQMEGVGTFSEEPLPAQLLIGSDWYAQMEMTRDAVLAWLAESKPQQTLAIVAARRCPSALRLAQMLGDAGVAFLDEIGALPELPLTTAIQRQTVRYFRRGHDVDDLCALADLLRRHAKKWSGISERDVRDWCAKAFEKVQSRNARMLAKAMPQDDAARLVEALGTWDAEVMWNAARGNWQRIIEVLETGSQPLEPLWQRMAALEVSGSFSSDHFLKAIESLLGTCKSQRVGDERYARVVLTTFTGAANQPWDRVLLLDAQEGKWPLLPDENPFLGDAARKRWNGRELTNRPPLLTSMDRFALEQSRLLNVISHARDGIMLSATATAADGSETHPNECVMRLLALRGDPLKEWRAAVFAANRTREKIAPFAALAEIHRKRRDPHLPFDEHLFHLGPLAAEVPPWPAARLDQARVTPATFAMQQVLGIESQGGFRRSEALAIGQLAHRWLGRALQAETGWIRFPERPEVDRRLQQQVNESVTKIAGWFRAENLELPLWWRSLFQKAQWLARRCLERVQDDGAWLSTEHALEQTVATAAGPLHLKGRFDLVLSDRDNLVAAALRIFDFKTGKTPEPRLAKAEQGNGLQFVAYRLMARDAGANDVEVGMIRQDAIFDALFAENSEDDLRAVLEFAARMQGSGCFGQLGAWRAERAARETLPIAATPIDEDVLKQKWIATWGGDE